MMAECQYMRRGKVNYFYSYPTALTVLQKQPDGVPVLE